MKKIDFKSMLIGFLLCIVAMSTIAGTRYSRKNMDELYKKIEDVEQTIAAVYESYDRIQLRLIAHEKHINNLQDTMNVRVEECLVKTEGMEELLFR